MLVRLLRVYRPSGWVRARWRGELLDLPADEASVLVERGWAVPVTLAEVESQARETR